MILKITYRKGRRDLRRDVRDPNFALTIGRWMLCAQARHTVPLDWKCVHHASSRTQEY